MVAGHFPESQILSSIGKRIFDVIHRLTVRENFGPEDTIKEEFLTDGRGVVLMDWSVLEVRRKRSEKAS